MKKNPENWTHADFQKHVEEVREAIQPSRQLHDYLQRNQPDPLKRSIPFAVVSEDVVRSGHDEAILIQTWLTMRPYLLVVASETAGAFDLLGFNIGVSSQKANSAPLPLETFDVAFYGENSAMRAIEWSCDAVEPGMHLTMHVRNRGLDSRQFRGVLWGRIQ